MSVRIPEPPVPDHWLLDANVLFSEWARFFCAVLAQKASATLFFTPLIEEEAFRNLVRLNRLSQEDALTRRQSLPDSLPAELDQTDATGYLPDVQFVQAKDRPIAASALSCVHRLGRNVGLITWNVKDFPRKPLLKKGVVRYTPDELAVKLLKIHGWPARELLDQTKGKMLAYQKSFPLQQPTDFSLRAQPWPENAEQWGDFLRRNRLYLFEKIAASEK